MRKCVRCNKANMQHSRSTFGIFLLFEILVFNWKPFSSDFSYCTFNSSYFSRCKYMCVFRLIQRVQFRILKFVPIKNKWDRNFFSIFFWIPNIPDWFKIGGNYMRYFGIQNVWSHVVNWTMDYLQFPRNLSEKGISPLCSYQEQYFFRHVLETFKHF